MDSIQASMLVPIVVEQTGRANGRTTFTRACCKTESSSSGRGSTTRVSNLIHRAVALPPVAGRTKDISVYINSPGGSVTAGLAIYDTMAVPHLRRGHLLRRPGGSMGAVLLAAGRKGKRFALRMPAS
jgi:ATP-dependent Clp protease protease subunit